MMLTVGQIKKFIEGQPDERVIDVFLVGSGFDTGVQVQFGKELGTNLLLNVLVPDDLKLAPKKSQE